MLLHHHHPHHHHNHNYHRHSCHHHWLVVGSCIWLHSNFINNCHKILQFFCSKFLEYSIICQVIELRNPSPRMGENYCEREGCGATVWFLFGRTEDAKEAVAELQNAKKTEDKWKFYLWQISTVNIEYFAQRHQESFFCIAFHKIGIKAQFSLLSMLTLHFILRLHDFIFLKKYYICQIRLKIHLQTGLPGFQVIIYWSVCHHHHYHHQYYNTIMQIDIRSYSNVRSYTQKRVLELEGRSEGKQCQISSSSKYHRHHQQQQQITKHKRELLAILKISRLLAVQTKIDRSLPNRCWQVKFIYYSGASLSSTVCNFSWLDSKSVHTWLENIAK